MGSEAYTHLLAFTQIKQYTKHHTLHKGGTNLQGSNKNIDN